MSSFFRMLLVIALVGASIAPASAQQDRGHGSIYYSPSGHRIGWARSLSSDSNADHVASAMCQGGQIDSYSLNAYSGGQGGVSATGAGPDLTTVLNDCYQVVKFDSSANHQCGGFGFNADGSVSSGVRKSEKSHVQDHLTSWQQAFIICNDDASVSGFDKFVGALDGLAKALGGGHDHDTNSGNGGNTGGYVAPTGGTSITFSNTTAQLVKLALKCANEQAYQAIQIPAGATQTYDASAWGASCTSYTVQITTTANDGSQTENEHTVNAGGPYAIVIKGDALDLDSAPAAPASLVIFNDTAQSVNFTVSCPDKTPTDLTVAANGRLSRVLHCTDGAMLSISTGTNANSTIKRYPVANGRTYHIQVDPNLNVFTLVSQ